MGVKSLWKLLAPVGRPVMLETMEGQIMAIDSSIWIYQFQATMRDNDGRALSNAHVLGFLRRIAKLLFYGIKPVFVFDGGAPALKRNTLNERRQKKSGAATSHAKLAEKLLAAQMRRVALNQTKGAQKSTKGKGKAPTDPVVLDDNTVYLEDIDPSMPKTPARKLIPQPSSTSPSKPKFHDHDPYRLPDVDLQAVVARATRAAVPDPRLATEDELRAFIEDMRPEDFDVTSPAFRELPTEVQYEIVGDLRLKSRQTSYARLQNMLKSAATPLDFSKQQIQNLRQRNTLTQQLLMTTDSIGKANITIPIRVASERNREYVLIKNEGNAGGWILGIRDEGTREKPIEIDHDSNKDVDDDDSDEEMEEVPIPEAGEPDADLREYQRSMVLAAIGDRNAHKKRTPQRTPSSSAASYPLFDLDGEDVVPILDDDEDEELALAIQESVDQANASKALPRSRRPVMGNAVASSSKLADATRRSSDSVSRYTLHDNDAFLHGNRLETALSIANAGPVRTPMRHPVRTSSSMFGTPDLLQPNTSPAAMRPTPSSFVFGEPVLLQSKTDSPALRATPPPPPLLQSETQAESALDSDEHMDEVLPVFSVSDSGISNLPNSLPRPVSPLPDASLKQSTIRGMEDVSYAVESGASIAHSSVSPPISPPPVLSSEQSETNVINETFNRRDEGCASVSASPVQPPLPLEPRPIVSEDDFPKDTSNVQEAYSDQLSSPARVPPGEVDSTPQPPAEPLALEPTSPEIISLEKETTLPSFISSDEVDDNEQVSDWSRSPSPIVGLEQPQPRSSPVAETWDAAQEMDPDAEEGEFARFMSQVKGRDLDDVRREIDEEIKVLNKQKKAAMRDSEDINQQMISQIMMMLSLFGIPYITAPMEAEAQCAELVTLGLVNGVITDDSDVFLFGSQRVYKNMFNQSKTVECFLLSDLSRELGLDRDTLIRLAYLLGSDYVDGLPGIGPVVAMELLEEFPGEDGLHKFKDWWMKVQSGKDRPEDNKSKFRKRFKKKFKDLYLPAEWPNPTVRDAYYHPTVDDSDEPFKWGLPDLDALREFLYSELGWPPVKVDELLLPVIQKIRKRGQAGALNKQGDLNGYFDVAGSGTVAPRKHQAYASKRLQQVVSDFRKKRKHGFKTPAADEQSGHSQSENDDDVPRKKKAKASKSKPVSAPRTPARRCTGRGRGAKKRSRTNEVSEDETDFPG